MQELRTRRRRLRCEWNIQLFDRSKRRNVDNIESLITHKNRRQVIFMCRWIVRRLSLALKFNRELKKEFRSANGARDAINLLRHIID